MESVADLAVTPMQEFLCLGGEARINYPSTLGENWKWRATDDQITNSLAKKLYKYMEMYGRVNEKILQEKAKAKAEAAKAEKEVTTDKAPTEGKTPVEEAKKPEIGKKLDVAA